MKNNTILEFFDFWSSKIINCFLTKNTVCKLDFFKPNERKSIKFLSGLGVLNWHQVFVLPLVFVVIQFTGNRVNSQSIRGIVPIAIPLTGSGIDGDAFAHQPQGTDFLYNNVGDLFDSTHPSLPDSHGVINPFDGTVFYKPPLVGSVTVPVTYQLKDPYLNDPTIFTLSNKINDNPNTYTWGAGSSPNKNEIQNCGAHFSYGAAIPGGRTTADNKAFIVPGGVIGDPNDLWCVFAGDRQVTNGSSYIDFEFLQAPLTMTGATFGDPDPFTNISPIISGSGAFVTGAPDATGGRTKGDILITIEFTQGGGDATVVLRRWTDAPDGSGTNWQYVVIPNSSFADNIFCTNNSVDTVVPFDVYGSGIGNGSYAPNQWAEGAINLTQVLKVTNNPCFIISTLFIRTRSSGNSAQSELKDFPGAPIQLNLDLSKLAVTCSEPVSLPVCSTTEAITTAYNTWKAGFSNTGGISPVTDNLADFPPLGNLTCGGQLTFEYKVFDACHKVPKTCTSTFTVVKDEAMPVIAALPAPSTIDCPALPAFAQATATDNCAVASLTFNDVTTPSNCAGNYSVTRTWTATDDCGNFSTATQTINVQDITAPTLTCPANQTVDCGVEPVFGIPTISDGCDSNPTLNDLGTTTRNNPDGSVTYTKTWSATDACGNTSATCSQSITVTACEGCTLGYWKNHTDRWCSAYTPSMLFGDVFVNAPSNLADLTLLEALNLGGGGIFNLARQGVAALLNACSDEVDFPAPYSSNPQSVIDAVNAAYLAGGNAPGKLGTQLDILNNTGCPLGGTSATHKEDSLNTSVGFTAFPVPFKDKLTIRYDFDYVSDVVIDVYNAEGVSVLSKTDTNSYLNKEVTLHLHSYKGQEQVYVVRVTTNRGSSVKKVMSSK